MFRQFRAVWELALFCVPVLYLFAFQASGGSRQNGASVTRAGALKKQSDLLKFDEIFIKLTRLTGISTLSKIGALQPLAARRVVLPGQ
jgi:hypothetical protein